MKKEKRVEKGAGYINKNGNNNRMNDKDRNRAVMGEC